MSLSNGSLAAIGRVGSPTRGQKGNEGEGVGTAESPGRFRFHSPANPVVVSSRPKDPGPDPRKLAITAKAYADLLLHMLPITNLGLTRLRIYTASRDQPTLKDHASAASRESAVRWHSMQNRGAG